MEGDVKYVHLKQYDNDVVDINTNCPWSFICEESMIHLQTHVVEYSTYVTFMS